MDGQDIDAGFSQHIAAIAEPAMELFRVGFDFFDKKNRAASLDGFVGSLERLQFHAFDVELDEINTRKVEFIDRHSTNFGRVFRVVDRLTDELVVGALAKL